MTKVSARKSRLMFETSDVVSGRAVVVEVYPFHARLRLKGKRTAFDISWAGIYYLGAKVAAEKARSEKKSGARSQK